MEDLELKANYFAREAMNEAKKIQEIKEIALNSLHNDEYKKGLLKILLKIIDISEEEFQGLNNLINSKKD